MNSLSTQGLGQIDLEAAVKSVVDKYAGTISEATKPYISEMAEAAKPAFRLVMDEYWLRIGLVAGGIALGGILLGTYIGRKI